MRVLVFFTVLLFTAGFAFAGPYGQGYDNNGPTVSISSPTSGQQFAAGTTSVTAAYSATDAGGGSISKYWASTNGTSWIDNALNTTYAISGLSNGGSYSFYVIAADDSDNNSTTASVSFSVLSTGGGVQPQTCAQKGGSVCTVSQNCSGTITTASDTNSCCIGTCVAKTCTELGGVTCDINSNDCSSWINQSTGCCLAGACTPKALETILCSFPTYLSREPVTAVFIEPSQLASKYDFNVIGKALEIKPSVLNNLADTIVTYYPQNTFYLVSTNLVDSPEFTPDQAYLLELLKNQAIFGKSVYSGSAENFSQIYSLIDSSRIRWWNVKTDDTCEPKINPGQLGISIQTMHYFRINNLWLLWRDIARKK